MINVLALQELPDESQTASPPQTGGGGGDPTSVFSILHGDQIVCVSRA